MKAKFEIGDLVSAHLNKQNYSGHGIIVASSGEFVEVYWVKEGATRTMSQHWLAHYKPENP